MGKNKTIIKLANATRVTRFRFVNWFWLALWRMGSIFSSGPAAIISWVIGFIVIGTISYNYIEIGTMFPQSGGMSNYAQYTHGSLLGFIAAWANWVSLVTIIPIEAVSAVQYIALGLGTGLSQLRH